MENEKIKVVISDMGLNEVVFIELTPEQVKLLEWLESYGYLDDYNIQTGVRFESIQAGGGVKTAFFLSKIS